MLLYCPDIGAANAVALRCISVIHGSSAVKKRRAWRCKRTAESPVTTACSVGGGA